MQTIQQLKSRIGQLEAREREIRAEIAGLRDELAGAELREKGFEVGQRIRVAHGQTFRVGDVVGFSGRYGGEILYIPLLRDGGFGETKSIPAYKVKAILSHPENAPVGDATGQDEA